MRAVPPQGGVPDASVDSSTTSGGVVVHCDSHAALLPKPPSPGQQQQQEQEQQQQQQFTHPISPARRQYTVVLVALIAALLSADQNLLSPNLSAAAAYFGLDDRQKDALLGGWLMAAFFIVGAPASLLVGFCADKFNRVRLLAFIVVLGEAPCLCTYWVTELWQFFVLRMLTGISVGGTFPLVFSMLGDLAPPSQRAALSSVIQIAVGAGIGGGQMLAGLLGPSTNWRLPFVVMAAPTLLLSLLLVATVTEPPRGGFEAALEGHLASGATYEPTITWPKVWRILAIPSNWIIILQGLPGCLPWGVLQTYINDYLHLSKGFSVQVSTTIILLFGVGCAVGVVAGGTAGQALYNWRKESMALLIGLAVMAGAAPVLLLINADLQAMGLPATLATAAAAGALASVAGPNLRAVVINVNSPESRGVALAMQSVTDDLGKGLGPVIVAGFIGRLGRQAAFNVATICGWGPCGLLLCCLALTMSKDEAAMQARLTATLQRISTSDFDPDLEPSASPLQQPRPDARSGQQLLRRSPGPDASSNSSGSSGAVAAAAALATGGGILRTLSRGLSRGNAVAPADSSASKPLLAAAAVDSASRSITVLADAGSVELQQLLTSLHPQQEQLRQQAPVSEGASALRLPSGASSYGDQQQQQPGSACSSSSSGSGSHPEDSRHHAAGFDGSGTSSSRGLHVLHSGAANVSAAGTRHRGGHGPRHRANASSSSSLSERALGEGVEQPGEGCESMLSPAAAEAATPGRLPGTRCSKAVVAHLSVSHRAASSCLG